MKILLSLVPLMILSAVGQSEPPPPPSPKTLPALKSPATIAPAEPSKLTKFDLNFPGGKPKELVAAIEKAMGRPLNVVIPDEYAGEIIPALRMTQVTVMELFRAMELASIKTEPYRTGTSFGAGSRPSYSYQQMQTSIIFQTSSGQVSDDSIWYFRGRQKAPDPSIWDNKPVPEKISRFYALTPYLEQGLKVEDITTAIQTGWKMLGDKEIPSISFHKETKLLIAVGEPAKLETIDAVLTALRPASESRFAGGRRGPVSQPRMAAPETNSRPPAPPVSPDNEP